MSREIRVELIMLVLASFIGLVSVTLFIVKYWLLAHKVILIMKDKTDKNLDRKAQIMFISVVLMGSIISMADTIFVFKWNLDTPRQSELVQVAYLLLVVPCICIVCILSNALWVLK